MSGDPRHAANPAEAAVSPGWLPELPPFDYDPRTRVVFGYGSLARLGELAAESGGARALLVTDRGIRQAGHPDRAAQSLAAAGIHVVLFDDVDPNPTTDTVDRAVIAARDVQADLFVAVGGGSAMDCAKGANFLLTNGGRMRDYWGVGKAKRPMLPLIAAPTTAGTGSEAQSFALISDSVSHVKMACGDKKAACRVAILDPELTLSMPAGVSAATGIDAISHAVESYVTTKRNGVSDVFSRRAWKLLIQGYSSVLSDPGDRSARGAVLLGAHFAGAAIENSMLGAAHALANPLTAAFNVTHGMAIGVMLPHVIRFNATVVGDRYARLAADLGLADRSDPLAAEHVASLVAELARRSGMPASLVDLKVPLDHVPALAAEAAKQWTGSFNPRPVTVDTLEELYRCAAEPFARRC